MTQTVDKVKEEIGRPVEYLQEFVSDHKGQIRDLPDVVATQGRRRVRQGKKVAKRARRASRTRHVGSPLAALVTLAAVAAVAGLLMSNRRRADENHFDPKS